MKRIFAFTLTFVMLILMSVSALSVSAADYGCDVDTYSSNVYVENLDTGAIVYGKNVYEQVPPASLTKMMTYIIVVENVPDLENTYITVTAEALKTLDPESSVMGLENYIGSQFSVLDLLYGLMLPSGNDAALVLADYIGDGSIDNFVDMMNRKAGQLGCSSTHFVNPHGLYNSMHYSSAYDLSVIAKYALYKPYFETIVGTAKYQVEGMDEALETTNYLIDPLRPEYYYKYAKGIKTGYTDEAGKCLVSIAEKDGYKYLCVALGAPYSYSEDINYAMIDSKALYEWMFTNISYVTVLSKDHVVDLIAVEYGKGEEFVNVVPEQDVVALLPQGYDESIITTDIQLPESTNAPVEKSEVLGTVSIYYDGEHVGTTNLITTQAVERNDFNYFIHRVIGFVVNNIIWLSIVFAVVVAVAIISINNRRQRKRRQARRRYR